MLADLNSDQAIIGMFKATPFQSNEGMCTWTSYRWLPINYQPDFSPSRATHGTTKSITRHVCASNSRSSPLSGFRLSKEESRQSRCSVRSPDPRRPVQTNGEVRSKIPVDLLPAQSRAEKGTRKDQYGIMPRVPIFSARVVKRTRTDQTKAGRDIAEFASAQKSFPQQRT